MYGAFTFQSGIALLLKVPFFCVPKQKKRKKKFNQEDRLMRRINDNFGLCVYRLGEAY